MPPKICKASKRHSMTGARITCDTQYTGEECPLRREHMWHLKSGYCHSGWCEGLKPRSYSGKPVPTCKHWLVCPCDCHDMITRIFALQDMPRVVVENPEYVPAKITMISLDERAQMAAERKAEQRAEREASQPPAPGSDEIHSPSGRTRKGLLDKWVELQCKMWLINADGKDCTPAWISEHIAMIEDVSPPSVGAIDAVLKRWVEIGYAVVEKKPTRFLSFTPEGQRLGLDVLKEKNRLQARKHQMNRHRGARV